MQKITYQGLYDRVASLTELATFASSLGALMKATKDPSCGAKQVGAVVARDPALSMRVLRTVNSSFYALNREIQTMEDAVVLLGFREIERLAIAVSVIKQFGSRTRRGVALNFLWRHSLVCAVAAEALAEAFRLRNVEPNDVYIAALLHDVGKAVLWQFLPEVAQEVVRVAEQEGLPAYLAEQEVMDGATHGHVGAWVAGNWGIPMAAVTCIQAHHALETIPREDLLPRVIAVADSVCYRVGVPALKTDGEPPALVLRPSAFLENNDAFFDRFRVLWDIKRSEIESIAS